MKQNVLIWSAYYRNESKTIWFAPKIISAKTTPRIGELGSRRNPWVVGVHIGLLASLLMLVLLLASFYYFWGCGSPFSCWRCDVPIVSAAVGLPPCCCGLHCICKHPCFWWRPYCVGSPVVAFIPAVACVPAVVSGLDIAVILNVAWVVLLLLLISLLLLASWLSQAFLLLLALLAFLLFLSKSKGGFQNVLKTNVLNNAHVSQLLHYKAGLLKNDGIIIYLQIKTNSLQMDISHRTILFYN